jgi:hypothetical protein
MSFPCLALPSIGVSLPTLSAGLSIPGLSLSTPSSLLCCKLPVFSIAIGPINLGISTGILTAIAAALNQLIKIVIAYIQALFNLRCPFQADPDGL